ncbi:hypothetical protein [Paracoccus sulfuroxidans]|uniref:hypothetical protein n=1 Tax=Paracoccus sulfuroxidans TaxID=384678 RepID=UPI00119DC8FB|nr:hypothetical protein [Paracoccus sulfuroxidans]
MNRKSPPGNGKSDGREERLKAALRANLSRRKAQGRARADEEQDRTGQDGEGAPSDTGPGNEE